LNILDLLEQDGVVFEKTRNIKEETYTSPCPACGGKDRFQIWVNDGAGGRWWCRQCSKKGGTIKYLKIFRNMPYPDACDFLGLTPYSSSISTSARLKNLRSANIWHPEPADVPSDIWQDQANKVIEAAEASLWSKEGMEIKSWLNSRGLKDEFIKKARLGCIPRDFTYSRKLWGLPHMIDENGISKELWLPSGLLIPYINGHTIRIRVRRFNSAGRYYVVPGSSTAPMLLDTKEVMVVVESELDALLLTQEVDFVGVVALGAVDFKPDIETTDKLKQAKLVLVALDSDNAGARASWCWWTKNFPNAKRWGTSPFGKDPTEAYQNGLDLKTWIKAGIPKYTSEKCDPPPSIEYVLHDIASPILAISTETTGSDPVNKLSRIYLSVPDKPEIIIDMAKYSKKDHDFVQQILNGPSLKIFHNALYDLVSLYKAGFKVKKPFFDTLLAAQILQNGFQKNDSFAAISNQYLSDSPKSNAVLLQLKKALALELEKHGLSQTADLEFNCLPAVVEMVLKGMLLDKNKLNGYRKKITEELRLLKAEIYKELGDTNLNSSPLLKALQRKGYKIKDTKRQSLSSFSTDPLIQKIIRYRKVSKLTEYCCDLPKHINPITGRIHPSYNQLLPATGRFSCSNPPLQNIPRSIRKCFVPAPGYKFVIADYSQIELRIAAEISQDKRMIEAYCEGQDLHKLTASLIMGKALDQISSDERQSAKVINFGLIYGMGAASLQVYARDNYGVKMTLQQAKIFKDKFFESYKGFADWYLSIQENPRLDVRTLGGRRRVLSNIRDFPKMLNTPIQGTGADIIKKSLGCLEILQGTGAFIIGTVHDEIILESREDKAIEVADLLKKVMEQAGEAFLKSVPVIAETKIMGSWGDK